MQQKSLKNLSVFCNFSAILATIIMKLTARERNKT